MALSPFLHAPASGISPTLSELELARRWVTAKFQGVHETNLPPAALVVRANHDPVQKNGRAGRPLRLGDATFPRGLYCHAFSQVLVRLPGPGQNFQAVVGVDSNEQTSGGRGSVRFAVKVGDTALVRTKIMHESTPAEALQVDLNGAREFILEVDAADDGISCDQADWAEARVLLQNGEQLWLADLPLLETGASLAPSTDPVFSFLYDGAPSSELLSQWQLHRHQRALDPQRTEHALVYTDPKTLLEVRCVAIEYHDFPTIEWTVHFTNKGESDTPILSQVLALDVSWEHPGPGDSLLHHHKGTFVRADDYEPLSTPLAKGQSIRFSPPGGRPCGHVWPYFNLEGNGGGRIVAVGWPGQWSAEFSRSSDATLHVAAGQELTHLRLRPGESIRTPLLVLQFWEGDWLRSQNLWRRWMLAHNVPRVKGRLPRPLLTPCSSHQFGEMIQADEASQIQFIERYLAEGIQPDYWWMDAGWYVNQSGWPNTGTWLVDSNRFPRGLRAITDHAHARGVKSIVWFEPERVTPGTWLHQNHPEWLLQGTLLNLGHAEARRWLTDHIDRILVEQGIDLYRQDYNIDPLPFWRAHDAEDRQGITENHYVTGYLAYWDELRRRHPDLVIDSCASGGHRNDLETMRRALPFLRSDHIFNPVGNQGHTYGLSFWLPYHGTGTSPHQFSLYELRSNLACPHDIPCWDVRDPHLDYDLLRRVVRDWRRYAECYLGDFYPLTPYTLEPEDWMAWQFDRPDLGRGLVQAFRRDRSIYETARLKLHGLQPDARYAVTNLDEPGGNREFSGRALMEEGLGVSLTQSPGAAVLLYQRAP